MSETGQDHRTGEATRSGPPEPSVPEYSPPPEPDRSAWGGWVTFAGITLALVGTLHVLEGTVAILEPDHYAVGRRGLVLQLDYSAWGWIHLVVGLALIAAGVGILNHSRLARMVGVVAAGLSALATMGFLAAAPIWAAVVITLDIVFIYAISVHGDEVH